MIIHHWWWKFKLSDLLICVFVFVSLCLGWCPTPLLPDIYIFTYLLWVFFSILCVFYRIICWNHYYDEMLMFFLMFLHCPSLTSSALCWGIILFVYFLSWIKKKVEKKVEKYEWDQIYIHLKSNKLNHFPSSSGRIFFSIYDTYKITQDDKLLWRGKKKAQNKKHQKSNWILNKNVAQRNMRFVDNPQWQWKEGTC